MKIPDDKVVVITGAAGGLGRALAVELCRRGYDLALVDLDREGLERMQTELGKMAGSRFSVHCADIAAEEAVKRLAAEVIAAHGRVDWLINNAAVSISQPFEGMLLGDLRRLFGVNYWGVVHCTKYFLPHLRQQKESRLVNVISGFAQMGFPGKTAYSSSKGAVMSFTYSLRTELTGTGVSVCLVIPPPMNTAIVAKGLHIDEVKRAAEMRFLEKHGMPVDEVAGRIIRQVRKGRFRIVVGARMFFIDLVSRWMPTRLHRVIGKRKIEFY